MRILIYLLLALILLSLVSALLALIRDRGDGQGTVRALTWRVGLSLLLFLLLMAGHHLGLLSPAAS